jgi:hypothetical protein
MTERKISKRKVKIPSEQETIQHILGLAREQGVEDRVKTLIMRTQDNIKSARDEVARKHMAHLGLVEIYKTIGCVGGLILDGIEVLPPDNSYKEEIDMTRGCVKLD